ncbi:RNA ligase RtcB family protein [Gammaproteobacteria bacterium 45_16_T64]|nr:RNA ligase RtcB family protein [Gammaproteobacteria bacterium 45_16_T64]
MGTYIQDIPFEGNARVRLMMSDANWLESNAVEQLKKTAELPCMCCGIGLPDLHPGKGQPIGATFVSHNCIYPHLVGSDIGCGMGLWKLDVAAKKVKLDRWVKKLVGLDGEWSGDKEQWLKSQGIEYNETPFDDVDHGLGTIGGGNHFAEIQRVEKVFDGQALEKIGLDKQSVVLLAHSGSRGLGQKILRQHVDTFGAQGLMTNDELGDSASQYLRQHNYAVRWAIANRALIARRFCEALNVKSQLLMNVSHNTVTALNKADEEAMKLSPDSGDDVKSEKSRFWIHRKGANPTDQGMVMIPGSRGSLSYLVRPRTEDNEALAKGGFSLAHGAGRKWKRSDTKDRLKGRYKAKDLMVTELGSRVICQSKELLYEEAPQAYKNIDVVVQDMVGAGMIDVIASFAPLITYKTRTS